MVYCTSLMRVRISGTKRGSTLALKYSRARASSLGIPAGISRDSLAAISRLVLGSVERTGTTVLKTASQTPHFVLDARHEFTMGEKNMKSLMKSTVILVTFAFSAADVPKCSPRTCSQIGWMNAPFHGDVNICGGSAPASDIMPERDSEGCSGQVSWTEGQIFCSKLGARLCTLDELLHDEVAGTGCEAETDPLWSSTPCKEGEGPRNHEIGRAHV